MEGRALNVVLRFCLFLGCCRTQCWWSWLILAWRLCLYVLGYHRQGQVPRFHDGCRIALDRGKVSRVPWCRVRRLDLCIIIQRSNHRSHLDLFWFHEYGCLAHLLHFLDKIAIFGFAEGCPRFDFYIRLCRFSLVLGLDFRHLFKERLLRGRNCRFSDVDLFLNIVVFNWHTLSTSGWFFIPFYTLRNRRSLVVQDIYHLWFENQISWLVSLDCWDWQIWVVRSSI